MHELSLAGGVLDLVERTAQRERFKRVTELRLEAGQLAGVDVRALRFALEGIAPGTLIEGARIEIEEPAGQAWCMPCAATVLVARRGDACPQCGSHQLQATGGDGLRIIDLRVSDE